MTRIYKQYQRRISFLSLLVIIAWGGLGFRLLDIQIINGKEYHAKGQKQGQTTEILPAMRGNIFDTNGIPLTRSTIHYTIAADPSQVNDKAGLAQVLSRVTGKSKTQYIEKLKAQSNFVYLARNLQKQYAKSIIEKDFDGIIIQQHSRRSYPQDNIAGQVVGFTNVDGKGLAGIEHQYNKHLSGNDGWIIKQRTGLGKVNTRNNYPKQSPVDGVDITLSIDIEYQSILHEALLKQLQKTKAKTATGIIINPQTGAILALASLPDYNPNKPNAVATENQKIRVFSDQFEPGSTFKIVAATAALDNNLVKLEDEFDCENGDFEYKSITIRDHQPHELLTFSEIIEQSSNIGIIKVASRIGNKTFYNYAQDFGFGTETKIGLNAESKGILRKTREWSPISLAEISMGHEVGITAIQLAMAYGAVANGGILLRPYIIDKIDGTDIRLKELEIIRKIADQSIMNQLSQVLVRAVESGTGTEAFIPGWQVAGKTGTAQKFIDGKYSHTKFVSNFVGYLPASNPQLLCVITLDEPSMGYHWGGTGAAPVFKKVMERIINLDDSIQIPENDKIESDQRLPVLVENKIKAEPILLSSIANDPKLEKKQQVSSPVIQAENIVPNVRGMSLKKAISTLNSSGFTSKFTGSGIVKWQSPRPGTITKSGTICSIGLE